MACVYEAAGYWSEGERKFQRCERVASALAGKKWRSHAAVAKDLEVGESVYVVDTTGALTGYIRHITKIEGGGYSISKAAITEI